MDVVALLHVLRRRALAVVLCLAAGIAGALVLTSQTTKLYRAEATVLVSVPASTSVTQGTQGLQLTSELLPTYADIAMSRSLAATVKQRLQLPESPETLRGKISAKAEDSKLVIDLTATDADPVRARSIADAVAGALSSSVANLEKERTEGSRIKVELLDAALTPRSAIEPRPVYNLAIGTLLGLGAGVLLALVLDTLDRTVKTPTQAEAGSAAPVLALLPRFRRGTSPVVALADPNQPAGEAYRTLRTSVQFLDPDHPLQVLLVTSATPGDGKTTTAVNLAIALAQSGERVVVVDADLRRASVAERLGIEGAVGLTTVVTRRASLDDAIQRWNDLLWVLPSGELPPNPSEICGSQSLGTVLEELRLQFDVVIVDAPPVLPVTDAVVLATQADGVLLVSWSGKTQRHLLADARRRLDGVGASVVGTVLNAVKSSTAQGYYASYRPLQQADSRRAVR